LSFRFILIKQVWEIKKRFNEPALQEERFKQVIKNILENAKQMSLSEIMVEKFWIMIHDKALELEYKII
jgi:chorismate mutase